MFALVDCNNFYASCERVFQPKLKDQPIVVLSNNDGCVIARSNEAKKLGIPMGAPAFEYQALFDKHSIKVFSSNYALYGDMSNRVMDILATHAPEIEIYSIDEAFLKFNNMLPSFDFIASGNDMRTDVLSSTGIPVSVGIAPTKSLAKVANKIAKKFPKDTNNVYHIANDSQRIKALKWLPIEDVWGIGHRHAKRLQALKINRAYEFTLLPEDWVRKQMSVVGLRLQQELKGIPCLDLDIAQPKKNIATTRSFDTNHADFNYLRERVVTFAVTCAEKLRAQQSCCNALMVFVHTNGHRKDLPQYSRNIVLQLPVPTNSSILIAQQAALGLQLIFKEGYAYKKAGVIVMEITPAKIKQLTLFGDDPAKHSYLMKTMDDINKAIGVKKLKLASQDIGRTWKMRQEKLSQRYTTNLNEIIKVKT
jgi:DNA polymerase V